MAKILGEAYIWWPKMRRYVHVRAPVDPPAGRLIYDMQAVQILLERVRLQVSAKEFRPAHRRMRQLMGPRRRSR